MKIFNKVAIIGTGLIGGSIGIDIKRLKLANQVIGVATKPKTLKIALRLKAIDKGFFSIRDAVYNADLIILSAPIQSILAFAPLVIKSAKRSAIITDVGSTKSEIVKEIERHLPKDLYFVGTHPLAGSEKSGISHAQSGLFKNTLCIITPTRKTNPRALSKVKDLWEKLGAKVEFLKPGTHDKIISATSHLAHIVSFSLMDSIPQDFLRFSASGLRDVTRVAQSDPKIWRDICLSNQSQIINSIQRFQDSLARLKSMISKRASRSLFNQFSRIKIKRQNLNL